MRITFNQTTKMFPDGTLLFAAELDRLIRATAPRRPISCTYPTDPVVEQLLQHLGLLKMMGLKGRRRITADNVRHWRFTTDTSAKGEQADPQVSDYEKFFAGSDSSKLYDGLVEAMTNCVQHAYTQKRNDNTGLKDDVRWWMFSQVKDGTYSVAFCDLGIGMKASLLESKKWPVAMVLRAVGMLSQFGSDSAYIRAALELGKSKTGQENRGKGLQDIQNVIKSIGKGSIRILSNRGMWFYSPTTNPPEKYGDYADSILGTLIWWQIPISKAA